MQTQDFICEFIFVLQFPYQVLGMGGRDTNINWWNFVHPALSTSYPPSWGVIDVMLSGHAVRMLPYAMESSLCDAMEISNNFLGYHPCPPKRKTEWDRFASEAVVLHYLILSLRWCMLFSPLCVGCARDARVVIHACVFIHDVSYVSSRQDVCCLTMRCRDKVIL